jgi:integrase
VLHTALGREVNQLLDRYLAVVELEESARKTYVRCPDVHVCPMLGALPLSKLNGEVLDTFYASCAAARRVVARRASLRDLLLVAGWGVVRARVMSS